MAPFGTEAMADDARRIETWVARLDERTEDLFAGVRDADPRRSERALDTLRSWLMILEVMILETQDAPYEPAVYRRLAERLALVQARLEAIDWLIEHRREPWYRRYLPWIAQLVELLLEHVGLGPLLPRLPSGRDVSSERPGRHRRALGRRF
jgi:hypothetical protein